MKPEDFEPSSGPASSTGVEYTKQGQLHPRDRWWAGVWIGWISFFAGLLIGKYLVEPLYYCKPPLTLEPIREIDK